MITSSHAVVRAKQRGIPRGIDLLLDQFGEELTSTLNRIILVAMVCAIIWKIVVSDIFTLKTPIFEIRTETGTINP